MMTEDDNMWRVKNGVAGGSCYIHPLLVVSEQLAVDTRDMMVP
jgi:hypothetical protein